jgi:hypothetical protein
MVMLKHNSKQHKSSIRTMRNINFGLAPEIFYGFSLGVLAALLFAFPLQTQERMKYLMLLPSSPGLEVLLNTPIPSCLA